MSHKLHWENIYAVKSSQEVSWTQDVPQTSLDFMHSFNLPADAAILDVGGGDSKLPDFLLSEGFTNITVLDISENAIERAKKRLGDKARSVKWIVSDILDFKPAEKYDVWHDRAAFHFLTTPEQIESYTRIASGAMKSHGHLITGTFSKQGPLKCSGLEIKQYDEQTLTEILSRTFEKITCITEDHITPFNTKQNFLFCSFVCKN